MLFLHCIIKLPCFFILFVLTSAQTVDEEKLIGYRETNLKLSQKSNLKTYNELSSQEFFDIITSYGTIKVRLLTEESPETVHYLKNLVNSGFYDGCGFYRAEPTGQTWDDGNPEPRNGYSLLQGGANSCNKQKSNNLKVEDKVPLTKRSISLISQTTEFFISLENHFEWNKAFTVWGMIDDDLSWYVVEKLVKLPTKQEKHPSGTILRILNDPVNFVIKMY